MNNVDEIQNLNETENGRGTCSAPWGKKSPQKQINSTYWLSLAWQIKESLLKIQTEAVWVSKV